jgi:hypothetical protein
LNRERGGDEEEMERGIKGKKIQEKTRGIY